MANQQIWRNIFNELEIFNAPINKYNNGDIFKIPINDFISDKQLNQLAESLNLAIDNLVTNRDGKKYFNNNFLDNCNVTPEIFKKTYLKKRYDSWYKSGSFTKLGNIFQASKNNVTSKFKEKITFQIPKDQFINSKIKLEKSIASLRKKIDSNDQEKGKSYKKFKREFGNLKSKKAFKNNLKKNQTVKDQIGSLFVNIIGVILLVPIIIIVFIVVSLVPKKYIEMIINKSNFAIKTIDLIKFDEGKIIDIIEGKFIKDKENNNNKDKVNLRYDFEIYNDPFQTNLG